MALRSSTNPLEISKEDRSAEEMVGNQASRRRKREQMSYRGRAQYFRRDKRERMAWWRHGGCALLSGGRDKETDFKGFFGRVNVHPLSVWPRDSPPSFHSLSLFLCFTRSRRRNPASTDETFHFHSRLALRSDGSIFPKSSNTVSFRIWPSLYPRIIEGYCDCWNGGWGISDW